MKKMSSHWMLLVALILALCGCAYSVERLEADSELRSKVMKKCVTMGTKAVNEQNCRNAAEAQARATGKAVTDFFKK
ncbi:MAG: EexN family lipoprotein [Gammaproteobacteria bacterium]|nr:EexN family lipoprotein [Gammaproteobacteria bacterium]MDH5728771.1 EexN family lipoprotein [Gammaproteobacteria bacterium]